MSIEEIRADELDTERFVADQVLQDTILTDVDETVAGIKRQHNVFEQPGIDPQSAFGYTIVEPLIRLRKDGVRNNCREFGMQIEVRCWDSVDARRATPARLPWETLERRSERILAEVPGVVSVTYAIAPKPPSTTEVV